MHLTFHLLVLGECLINGRNNNLSELGVIISSIFFPGFLTNQLKLLRQLKFHFNFINNKLVINSSLFFDLLISYINLYKMWNVNY